MGSSQKQSQVVILCGGKGTRIRGVDDSLPKPMIPVGKHPILVHIMEHYARFGYRNIILCLGHLGDVIRSHLGARDNANFTHVPFTLPSRTVVQLTLAETGEDSMTGSRVWQIRELVGDDDFLLTYGDGLSDVPIQQLVEFHNSHSAAMTLTAVRPPSRFGEVEVGTDGLATSFNEKPQVSAGLISGGFFVCRPTIFDYLSPREDLVLEAEPMRRMTSDRRLAAYVHEGFWQCMDTYRDWLLLNELEATGEAPWRH